MYRLSRVMFAAAEPLIKVSRKGGILTLTMNRPEQLNALNMDLINSLAENIVLCDRDPECRVMILTGTGRAFVAGADIKMMSTKTFAEFYREDFLCGLDVLGTTHTPIIAAVNGFALGGGCELAMACDIIVASEKAVFGQPEITIGTIPGLGGTQRLTRAIGKAKAMEWVLTGRKYTAEEAEKAGLVSRVVKHEELMSTAMKIAEEIASHSNIAVRLAKDAVNKSQESTLSQGLAFEKAMFFSTFATEDQKIGMKAFIEKKEPKFVGR